MADEEEKQGISKYLDEIGLGILAGLIKGLIYDEQGRNRFSLLAELIGQNTTAINKRALKATESDATDTNSYVKRQIKPLMLTQLITSTQVISQLQHKEQRQIVQFRLSK